VLPNVILLNIIEEIPDNYESFDNCCNPCVPTLIESYRDDILSIINSKLTINSINKGEGNTGNHITPYDQINSTNIKKPIPTSPSRKGYETISNNTPKELSKTDYVSLLQSITPPTFNITDSTTPSPILSSEQIFSQARWNEDPEHFFPSGENTPSIYRNTTVSENQPIINEPIESLKLVFEENLPIPEKGSKGENNKSMMEDVPKSISQIYQISNQNRKKKKSKNKKTNQSLHLHYIL